MLGLNIKPNTTVVIPTFNDSVADLTRAVNSVITQTHAPKEIIVVDDGSENNSSSLVIDNLAETTSESKLTLLKKNNGGPSSARNYGLRHCSTQYVTFLDSDDEMLERNIEVKENALNDLNEDYFGVYGTYIRNPGGIHHYADMDGVMNTDLIGRVGGLPGAAPTYLFRTQCLLEVNGFDEALVNNEDFDLIARLIRKGFQAKGSLGAGYIRNYRSGSLSRNDRYISTYKNVQRFLIKAEFENYFSPQELARRKAANELWLGRRLLGKSGHRTLAIKHLNQAFDFVRPNGWRQYMAYTIGKVGKNILRMFGASS